MGVLDEIWRVGDGRAERLLRTLAERRRAELVCTGELGESRTWFEAGWDGALVRVSFVAHGPPLFRVAVTFASEAAYVLGRGPAFRIVRDPLVSRTVALVTPASLDPMGRELQELVVDEHTRVSTRVPAETVAVLPAAVRERLHSFFSRGQVATLESDGRTVRFACDFLPGEKDVSWMLEAVGEIATANARWFRRVAASLSGARYVHPSGAFAARSLPAFEVAVGDRAVRVEPAAVDRGFSLVATLADTRAPFEARLGQAESPMAWARGTRAMEQVASVGEAALSSDGTMLRLVLHGTSDSERILAGCRLLHALTAPPSSGAFR